MFTLKCKYWMNNLISPQWLSRHMLTKISFHSPYHHDFVDANLQSSVFPLPICLHIPTQGEMYIIRHTQINDRNPVF